MDILLVHQNFPGQFRHLAPRLAARGDRVVALTMSPGPAVEGVEIQKAAPKFSTSSKLPWAQDFETKLLRAESAYRKARELKDGGFYPDLIYGHMGWGDMLFLKDVWPNARLGVYCEFFYSHVNSDAQFDPEFKLPGDELDHSVRLKLKTLPQRLHFEMANGGISPMQFQANTYPLPFRDRISVIHDGIDTKKIQPTRGATIAVSGGRRFSHDDEIITFVSRSLEPYRGYHKFMRALPRLLRERPNAQVFIIGKPEGGYGAPPPQSTWKDVFLNEVRDEIDLSRVFFTGAINYETLIAILSLSRLHVYLTYPFVLSWSMLEAMALGAPILGSNTGPVAEVIEDGRNGLLVDFFDEDMLVDKAVELLSSSAMRAEFGKNARDTVVTKYDLYNQCLPAQLAWLDELVQHAPRPAFLEA